MISTSLLLVAVVLLLTSNAVAVWFRLRMARYRKRWQESLGLREGGEPSQKWESVMDVSRSSHGWDYGDRHGRS